MKPKIKLNKLDYKALEEHGFDFELWDNENQGYFIDYNEIENYIGKEDADIVATFTISDGWYIDFLVIKNGIVNKDLTLDSWGGTNPIEDTLKLLKDGVITLE